MAISLDLEPQNDYITVDINLTPIDQKMVDHLGSGKEVLVEQIGQRHAVRMPLTGHEIVILKSI